MMMMMMMLTVQSLVTGPCRDDPEHVLCLAPLSFLLHSNGDISDDVTTTIKMVMMMMMMMVMMMMMMMMTVQSLVTGPSRDHPEHVLCLAPLSFLFLLSFHLHSNGDISDDDDDDGDYNDDESIDVLGHRTLSG